MAESLSSECTPLKHAYDTCFNAWFEGYLEPTTSQKPQADQSQRAKEMAAEYEEKCGKLWTGYRECVQVRRYVLGCHE
jgi:TRIAP1/MDM35 family protein